MYAGVFLIYIVSKVLKFDRRPNALLQEIAKQMKGNFFLLLFYLTFQDLAINISLQLSDLNDAIILNVLSAVLCFILTVYVCIMFGMFLYIINKKKID